MICLNKNNPEIQSMLKASGLSELELGALINTWMELNPGEDFPTLEDLGISVVTDSALSNKDPFIGIVLANYNVSISNNRYKYNGNSYNEDQILSKLLGISVSKNNVVKFDAKKFFEANPLVLQDIQEATGMSKSSIINKYQNHVTSSENIISTLFDVDRFVNSIETNYIEDAIIEEDDSANKYIKPGVQELFDSNPELANAVYEALGFNKNLGKAKVISKTTAKEILNSFDGGMRENFKNVINKLLEIPAFAERTINYVERPVGNPMGFYDSLNDFLGLDILSKQETNAAQARVIVEEVIHSLTSRPFKITKGLMSGSLSEAEKKFVNDISNLRKEVLRQRPQNANDYYGLSSDEEFVARAFMDERFQEYLSRIEIQRTNVFSKIIEYIKQLLGSYVTVKDNSALQEVLGLTEDFISKKQITPQQKQQAQQQYSQYLDTIFPDSKVKDIVYHDTSHSKAIKNYKEYLQSKYDKKIDYINKETFGDPNYIEVFFKDGTSEILNEEESLKFVPFETFDKNLIGSIDGSVSGKGFYFYTNPEERYNRSRFFTLNALINVKNTADKSDSNLKDLFEEPSKSTDLLKKQGYDSVVGKLSTIGTEYVVFEPEQIHILGSKQDIEGFKEFVQQPSTKIKKGVLELFESNPELANTVYEALGFNIINEAEITYTDEDGKHCAKIGLTNTTKGTGWKIVKDFKGKPKHSQGGYDITIKDNGFYVNDIKAKNGLLLINKNI